MSARKLRVIGGFLVFGRHVVERPVIRPDGLCVLEAVEASASDDGFIVDGRPVDEWTEIAVLTVGRRVVGSRLLRPPVRRWRESDWDRLAEASRTWAGITEEYPVPACEGGPGYADYVAGDADLAA